MKQPSRHRPFDMTPSRVAVVVAGGFVSLEIFVAVQLYLGFRTWLDPITWAESFLWAVPDTLIWMLLAPLIVHTAVRLPLDAGHRISRALIHLVAGVAISYSVLGLRAGFEVLAGWPLDYSEALRWSLGAPARLIANFWRLGTTFPAGIVLYWAILVLVHAYRAVQLVHEREVSLAEMESDLAKAQLDALKMQLQPHFLFNTLNSIGVLMRRDVDAAGRMLVRLSALLRITFENAGTQVVALSEELAFLEGYLDIQQTRFQDRLTVHIDVDDEALGAQVPNLILQPIVENAIQHGIATRVEPGRVTIGAHRRAGRIVLQVADDGPGILDAPRPARNGVGLANTRKRLEALYGDQQTLETARGAEGGTVVTLTFPYRPAGAGGSEHGACD